MRTALSNVLGEFLDAREVIHADTVNYQIVCPCCREGVFKVERIGHGRRAAAEFFSHRRATEATRACEERVGSFSRRWIAETNAAVRGQTLEAFLGVMQDAITLDRRLFGPTDPKAVQDAVFGDEKALPLIIYAMDAIVSRDPASAEAAFAQKVDDCLDRIHGKGYELDTAFGRGVSRRMTCDVYRHLLTVQARPSLEFALRHVMTKQMMLLENARRTRALRAEEEDLSAVYGILRLPTTVHALRKFETLMYLPGKIPAMPGRRSQPALATFLSLVEHDLMSTLLRLPYQAMAANAVAGRPVLDGISTVTEGFHGMRPIAGMGPLTPPPVTPPPRREAKGSGDHLLSLHVTAPGMR